MPTSVKDVDFKKSETYLIKDGETFQSMMLSRDNLEGFSLYLPVYLEDEKIGGSRQQQLDNLPREMKLQSIILGVSQDVLSSEEKFKMLEYEIENLQQNLSETGLIVLAGLTSESNKDDIISAINDQTKRSIQRISKLYPTNTVVVANIDSPKDIPNCTSLEKMSENNLLVEEKDLEKAKEKIENIAEMIKSKTSSPYEQHLLALHYISQLQYNLDDSQPYNKSRSLAEIAKNEGEFICCVGYARLYTQIMRSLGIDAETTDAKEHLRAKVYIKDEKYGINGIYLVEPTWISKDSSEKGPIFRENRFVNMSLNSLIDAYFKSSTTEKLRASYEDRMKAMNVVYRDITEAFKTKKFSSQYDLKSYLSALSLENNNLEYEELSVRLEQKFPQDKFPLNGQDLIESVEEIRNARQEEEKSKKNPPFSVMTKRERRKSLEKFFDENEDHFFVSMLQNRQAELPSLVSAIKKKIDKFSIDGCYVLPKAIKEDLMSHLDYLTIKYKNKNYPNKKLYSIAKKFVIKHLESAPTLDETSKEEVFGSTDALKKLRRNFTKLSDAQFQKTLKETKEISQETMEKAGSEIKKFVKESDYSHLKQRTKNPERTL